MALLVDSGPLYSYIDKDDAEHHSCLDLLRNHPEQLIVPILVVAEVTYLLGSRRGAVAEVRFLADLANAVFSTETVVAVDWLRIAELVVQYRNLGLGTVDASVVAAAERLGVTTIATLDRRDFGAVRPRHAPAFELVP